MAAKYAHSIGMGDVIQLPGDHRSWTVAWVDESVNGLSTHLRLVDHPSRVVVVNAHSSVHVSVNAPRCNHGSRFEHCDRDCAWPADIDALYLNH